MIPLSPLRSSLRLARPEDLDPLVPLAIALGQQHARYDAHRFRPEWFARERSLAQTYRDFFVAPLADLAAVVLVACDAGDHVLGHAFARLEEDSFLDLCPPSGWLHDLYLHENARGHGLGRRLLDEAIARLRALGAQRIMLSASPRNESARQLFIERGFAHTMSEYTLAPDAL